MQPSPCRQVLQDLTGDEHSARKTLEEKAGKMEAKDVATVTYCDPLRLSDSASVASSHGADTALHTYTHKDNTIIHCVSSLLSYDHIIVLVIISFHPHCQDDGTAGLLRQLARQGVGIPLDESGHA